jgi:hypothetical protein
VSVIVGGRVYGTIAEGAAPVLSSMGAGLKLNSYGNLLIGWGWALPGRRSVPHSRPSDTLVSYLIDGATPPLAQSVASSVLRVRNFCEAIVQADSPRLGYTATRIVLLVGEIILARLAVCMLEGAVNFFFFVWIVG